MTKCASPEELLEFINKVREAGGSYPLEALMPGVPLDGTNCLLARNLDFNCAVYNTNTEQDQVIWCMWFGNEALRDRIAEKLNLGKTNLSQGSLDNIIFGVILPPEIGLVAEYFDQHKYPFS